MGAYTAKEYCTYAEIEVNAYEDVSHTQLLVKLMALDSNHNWG